MQIIKKHVRSGKSPLSLIINRMDEYSRYSKNISINSPSKIYTKAPNNCYKNKLCTVIEIINSDDYKCKLYPNPSPLYDMDSFSSDIISAYISDNNYTLETFNKRDLTDRCIFIENMNMYHNKIIFLSLLHV